MKSVRNQPPPVAAAVASGPATAQPRVPTTGTTPTDNLLGMLIAAEPQQQKQIIGEHLYREIFSMHPDLSEKIIGKLLAKQLCQVTRTEIKHKNLLSSYHVTHLRAALQDKPCLTVHHLRVFEKALYLALLQLM